MLSCLGCLSPSLGWKSMLSFSITKIPLLLVCQSHRHVLRNRYPLPADAFGINRCSMDRFPRFCSSSAALSVSSKLPRQGAPAQSKKAKKRARRESPEGEYRYKLDMCSKNGNLADAIRLYDDARENGVQFSLYHYNILLYLCSSFGTLPVEVGDDNVEMDLSLNRGFEIFRQMVADQIAPNEATFTSMARLAARMEDSEMAFDLVKQMKSSGIPPKLRSYEPALNGFCKKGEAEKAYEVDAHMVESGVVIDESGISALLKLSADVKNADKVYEMLQRLRVTVRQVAESTAVVVENWFNSEAAVKAGKEKWDIGKVKEGVKKGGGGWHGQGWLGRGEWNVVRTTMGKTGICTSCSERLVCIDIDPVETESFASSLADLACQREVKAEFKNFQEWVQKHGPFDAVVDGANLGLINQREFNFSQLNLVVNKLQQMSPLKRLPLIVLHRGRVNGGPARSFNNQKLLETWKKANALYVTPAGSNDDWYWLYAAVTYKCLLVTNDEMRDHLFQLLGTSFFPRWKEKHQVRLSFSCNRPILHMPPPYSIVTQESETGSWHIPTVLGDDIEAPRQWVCAARARAKLRRSF